MSYFGGGASMSVVLEAFVGKGRAAWVVDDGSSWKSSSSSLGASLSDDAMVFGI